MKYRVVFSVKSVEKNDPDCGYLVDRKRTFRSMPKALAFSRNIKKYITDKEQLIGKPLIEDAA